MKQPTKVDVFCQDCRFGGGVVENYLIDCNNDERNPKRFKVIANKKACNYFERRKK